jgi:hypothetical protein
MWMPPAPPCPLIIVPARPIVFLQGACSPLGPLPGGRWSTDLAGSLGVGVKAIGGEPAGL